MRFCRTIVVLSAALLLTSCGSSPPSRFYSLDPVFQQSQVTDLGDLQIGCGPFELPDRLDRPPIVVRGTRNEVIIDEFSRWADDLGQRFQSVVARNLVVATGSARIFERPWRDELEMDYLVSGKVDEFSADTEGKVKLVVRWMIMNDKTPGVLEARESVYSEAADPDDYGDIAAAMSRTVASFAGDIASEIEKLEAARPQGAN